MATALPNIMDIFRGAPINPQQTGGSGNQNQQNTSANGVVPEDANKGDGNNQNQNQNTGDGNKGTGDDKPANPLDPFAKLWDAPTKEELERQNANSGVDFENVDANKMMEAAKKVDFTQILTPEMQQAIAKGGEEGMKAVIQAMNMTNQLTYGQSALAASKMIGAAVKQAKTEVASQIPDLVKAAVVSSNLAKANPVFQNPAVAPIVEGLKSQLLTKFPNATDAQLTEMAQNYFIGVSQSFGVIPPNKNSGNDGSDKKNKKQNMTGKPDDDWENFFSN